MAGIEIRRKPLELLRFESPALDLPSDSATWSHGLGGRPDYLAAFARCTIAERGYTVGDEVPLNVLDKDTGFRGALLADQVNITFQYLGSKTLLELVSPYSWFDMNVSNWEYRVRAARWVA